MKPAVLPLAFIVALCLTAAAPKTPATPVTSLDRSTHQLDRRLQQAIVAAAERDLALYGGRTPIPGVLIGVWIPGQGEFIKGIGYADVAHKRSFRIDDRFRIGSNTKTFVVSTLLQLVDEGKLKLDDPISAFNLGVTVPNARNITVRQLCDMRSGLVDAYNTPQMNKIDLGPNTRVSVRQLINWAGAQPPLFAPGAKYNYSNTNYLLLGLIIEAITHDTVSHQIEQRFIQPYHLLGTRFPVDDPNMPEPYAHGYGLNSRDEWTDVSVDVPPSLTGAAGAMISDVPDMQRWVKLYVTGATNSKASQVQRLKCLPVGKGNNAFGLGIACSNGWYGYTGGLPGYNTAAFYLPARDATVIAFVTAQREKPDPGVANSIARDISKIIFPQNVMMQ